MKNPRPRCPNPACQNHLRPVRGFYARDGFRVTAHDSQRVPRYRCRTCGRRFSASVEKPPRWQHRPELNRKVLALAASGVSLRRMETLLGCSKTTLRHKVEYLAEEAHRAHARFLAKTRVGFVMMDELETFIQSKHHPVSVPVVVRVKTGEILAFEVCRTPSKSPFAGAGLALVPGIPSDAWIADDRPRGVPAALAACRHSLKPGASISTDGASSYPKWIHRHLPGVTHLVRHSPKNNSLGRAKRKASGEPREHDPLFAINLLFAKMRNDLARLGRKTWTTSKSIDGLRRHLWLYVAWNNGYQLR